MEEKVKKIVVDLEDGFIELDGRRSEIDKSSCKLSVYGKIPRKIELECEEGND